MDTTPPPSQSKDGYTPVLQDDPYPPPSIENPTMVTPGGPPPGYQMPPGGYAPAPPVFQQQSHTSNVVVVNQPSSQPETNTLVMRHRAPTYVTLTVVMMVLCLMHCNLLSVGLLVPGLICALTADKHNQRGEYDRANSCGHFALFCNVCVVVKYIFLILAAIAIVIVYLTIGFEWLTGAKTNAPPDTLLQGSNLSF